MSTVDRVQQSVMGELLRGERRPGSWIRQDELAEQLGVSKIPVREGLQRLVALGLLRSESNRGVQVPALTSIEADEIFTLRRGIELQLLDRSIDSLTIVDLAEAEIALAAGVGDSTEQNWAFHRALYRASGWARGLAIVEILHAAVAPYVCLYVEDLGGATNSSAEHRAMLDACRERDRLVALDLLETHLDNAAQSLVSYLRTREDR